MEERSAPLEKNSSRRLWRNFWNEDFWGLPAADCKERGVTLGPLRLLFSREALLLCRAEGPVEHFVHNMVEVEVEYTLRYMGVLRRLGRRVPTLSRSLCHIIASGMFNAIFEVVIHDMPYEQALRDVGAAAGVLYGWLVKTDGGMIPYLLK